MATWRAERLTKASAVANDERRRHAEISDLVLPCPNFEKMESGTAAGGAERVALSRMSEMGIGVGLHPVYNAARRLYGRRGYVPDGRGVTYKTNREVVIADDNLVLHFEKKIPIPISTGSGDLSPQYSLGTN